MGVIGYIALTGTLLAGAAVPAPLARLSQGLLRAASRLHVATGWGPGSGQSVDAPRVWSPSWEWRTFAAFTVPLDGAATYHARLHLGVTAGDVRVRLGPNGNPSTVTATGVVEIEGEAVPIGGGLAVVELQIRSELTGATSTAAVVWSDTGYAQLPSDPGYAREFWDGQDRHVVPGQGFAAGGGWAVVPWPARRRTDSDRTYTVQALSYASVLGVHVWGESDGIAVPTQRGDVRILAAQDLAHRQAAASLLGRTPYVQTIALGALSLDGRDQWGRVSDLSAGVEVVPPMPVDAQESYALRIPLVHDQLDDVDVEVRAYVDGVLVQTTTSTIPPLTPDVGDGGSYLRWRLLFPSDAIADAWRESTADVPAIETVVQVTTPGLLSVEIEALATVVVLPPTLIPQRPAPAVSPLPTGTRIESLVDYLTAPDEPWGTLRREIASWQDLDFTASAAVSVYEASPVPVVRVRVDAVLTDCTLEVELIESDGVTSAGTILLDATGETDLLMDGSIDVPGGEWYYVRVDTTDAGSGAVGGVRLYEEKLVDPTSLPYADRATLLAATPLEGATGYVATYATPVEVWQYTASGWALLAAEWDGVTSGETLADLLTYDGVTGALARVGVAERVWDGAAWAIWRDSWDGTSSGQTLADLLAVADAVEGATVVLGETPWRFAAALPIDAGAGGGTIPFWLPQRVYDAGTAEVQGWQSGAEADATELAARGITAVVAAGGAITYPGTYIRLVCTGGGTTGFTYLAALVSGVSTSTRVLMISELRGTVAGTTALGSTNKIGYFIGDGTNCTRWEQRSAGVAASHPSNTLQSHTGTSWGPSGLARGLGSALPDLSSSPELVTVIDEAEDVSTVIRGGKIYASESRKMGTTSANRAALSVGVGSAPSGNNATMDVYRAWVITW